MKVNKSHIAPGMSYQFIALLLSMAGSSWAWTADAPPNPKAASAEAAPLLADTILFNGMIFTSDPGHPNVQALAIQGDRIEAVGDSEQIKRLAGPRTKQIDLGGRTVIPGLNDAHMHLEVYPLEFLGS
jgi:hypothetical protein